MLIVVDLPGHLVFLSTEVVGLFARGLNSVVHQIGHLLVAVA